MIVIDWDASLPPLLEPEHHAVALSHVMVELHASHKVVCCVGAGATTSTGLQDFRSSTGLYSNPPLSSSNEMSSSPSKLSHSSSSSSSSSSLSQRNIKQLFSYTSLIDPTSRQQHFEYMASLRQQSVEAIKFSKQRNKRQRTQQQQQQRARTTSEPDPCHTPASSCSSSSFSSLSSSSWQDETVPLVKPFVAKQRNKGITSFHSFMIELKRMGKLERVYSQNVDGFEKASGLSIVNLTGVTPSNWIKSHNKHDDSNETHETNRKRERKQDDELIGDCVLLHGSVHAIKCSTCSYVGEWSDRFDFAIEQGKSIACPDCSHKNQNRQHRLSRSCTKTTRSFLRPALLLYDEPMTTHSNDSNLIEISKILNKDLNNKPDMLIVWGTSLKIPGFRQLVKRMATQVHVHQGLCILVNREQVGKEWNQVFDYHFICDCDDFVDRIRSDWQSGVHLSQDWINV
ncbi:NAD-dependent deacetylase hst3 [Microbotryomycetes sp. JL221]|nr:NAD-dependent deacetylase hst3 [Microbotryomycetes sp. JL221]